MKASRLPSPVQKKRYWHKAFLLGLGLSFLFFLPFLIYDQGLFLYYGDFNVQQVPFYQMIHDSIRSGNLGWSHTTDLGANIIGSYSFYLMGSPFFWLTLPFPSEAVPYLMAPLFMLKFACASLTGYIFLKRYVRNKDMAVIGGILYAFSGFSIYNIFFNHFHEAIVIFPLLLAAVDEYMYNRRRGLLAAAVFASCVFNYYFFAGQVIFVLIYWIVRMISGSFKITPRDFLRMAAEVLIGFGATAFILLPTVLAVIQNPRVDNAPSGWGALLYSSEQRYVHILESFFFPPDIPARPNFTPDSNAKWGSVAAWLPLFSMTGVIAYIQAKKHTNWLKRLLVALFIIAFIPILNSMFQLFNSAYYARWFYMLTLMCALATIVSLENSKTDWRRALTWTGSITIIILVAVGFMPQTTEAQSGETVTTYGLMQYPDRFWAYGAIALVSLAVLALLLKLMRKNRKKFIRCTYVCLGVITVFYSSYLLILGKTQGYSSQDFIIPHVLNKGGEIDLPDTNSARSDFYKTMDNMAMFWQIPSIQAFQSIVPGSVMEFYPSIGVTRDVGSRPETDVYGLRSFTSTRWLFDYKFDGDSFTDQDNKTVMPGWTYYDTQNGFDIWENEYYIPMGFTYDTFIDEAKYKSCAEGNRHLLLLKAMVLSDEQLAKYADITGGKSSGESFIYGEEQYKKDCLARRETTCTNFVYDNSGFSAKIDLAGKDDQLVFFSVPYESGWSATVNGQPAEVEKVNVGFMAVRVPGGQQSDIRFDYETPGLKTGLIITGIFVLLFLAYIIFFRGKRPQQPPAKRSFRIMRKMKAQRVIAGASAQPKTGGGAPAGEEALSPQAQSLIDEMIGEERSSGDKL